MARHAAGVSASRRKTLSRWLRHNRLRRWCERTAGVPQKLRALTLGATSVAIISTTLAAFVVTNPQVAVANVTPSLWINPGSTTVLPYYQKEGDPYPIGYIVVEGDRSNLCIMVKDDSAYTCRSVDLRK